MGLSGMTYTTLTPSKSIVTSAEKISLILKIIDDDAVIAIVIQDEGVCLKLDLNDPTIRIINHNVF